MRPSEAQRGKKQPYLKVAAIHKWTESRRFETVRNNGFIGQDATAEKGTFFRLPLMRPA